MKPKKQVPPETVSIIEFQDYVLSHFRRSCAPVDYQRQHWVTFSHKECAQLRLMYCVKTGAMKFSLDGEHWFSCAYGEVTEQRV